MVSKCNIRYTPIAALGNGRALPQLEAAARIPWRCAATTAARGSWVIYILDIEPSATPAFRWTDDLGRTWQPKVPITHDWQPLSGGVEVRLNQRDWESGYVIAFGARDQLVSRIEKIEGNVLTLRTRPTAR